MKNPLRSGIVALIAIAFSTADSWAARTSGARLTIADNKVSIAGKPAASGTTIAPGDTITTGSRSRAELTLPDGTVVRIGQGSSFTYTGSKLVLNQGTALVHATHKGTTVVSGSRSYTGGPAVVSAEVSKKTDGLYILQGTGKVNGSPLIAGQTSVLDRGKDRTFTFDLQKMVGSSALVTKFPQTPWVSQTQVLAGVQHQLLTAKVTPAGKPGAPLASHDIVSSKVANLVSTGAAGTSLAGRAGRPGSSVSGALQLLSGPLSLGADKVAVIKSAAISSVTNGGTLQVSGGSITSSGSLTLSGTIFTAGASTQIFNGSGLTLIASEGQGSLTKMSAATVNLGSAASNYSGGAGFTSTLGGVGATAILINPSNFVLNTSVSAGTSAAGIINTNGNAGGNLTLGAVNTFTGATNVNAGTLNVNTGVSGVNVLSAITTGNTTGGLLTFANGNTSGVVTTTLGTSGFDGGITKTGAGRLTLTGANIYTSATTVKVNAGSVIGQSVGANTGTLVLNGGNTLGGLVQNGAVLTVNGVQTTIVAGQTLTVGGVNYIATPVTGGGTSPGTLNLRPVTH